VQGDVSNQAGGAKTAQSFGRTILRLMGQFGRVFRSKDESDFN
jgi:hypothetical protein